MDAERNPELARKLLRVLYEKTTEGKIKWSPTIFSGVYQFKSKDAFVEVWPADSGEDRFRVFAGGEQKSKLVASIKALESVDDDRVVWGLYELIEPEFIDAEGAVAQLLAEAGHVEVS